MYMCKSGVETLNRLWYIARPRVHDAGLCLFFFFGNVEFSGWSEVFWHLCKLFQAKLHIMTLHIRLYNFNAHMIEGIHIRTAWDNEVDRLASFDASLINLDRMSKHAAQLIDPVDVSLISGVSRSISLSQAVQSRPDHPLQCSMRGAVAQEKFPMWLSFFIVVSFCTSWQTISAFSLDSSLRAFGSSVSGGFDLDGNEYPGTVEETLPFLIMQTACV